MNINGLIILVGICLGLSFAFAEKVEKISVKESIQPRNEGAMWFYKSFFKEDGEKLVPSGLVREEIIEVKEIEGVKCYHVRLTMDWRSIADRLSGVALEEDAYTYFWEYPAKNGSYHFEPNEEKKAPTKLSDFQLTLPFPVKKGKKYHASGADYEVIDTDRKVKVPAGQFSCVVYQITYPDEEEKAKEDNEEILKTRERLFMAKGIGLVIVEGDIWEDGKWQLDFRDELSNYDLMVEVKK